MRIIKVEPKQLKSPAERRKAKGLVLFKRGYVAIMNTEVTNFKVLSETEPVTDNGVKPAYNVILAKNVTKCTCPDFVYNGMLECKHIYAAIYARREAGYRCNK